MSGGFFRGTSADQDTRFSNKQAKLLKSQKFAPELEHLVDMTKVKMDVMRPWIANRVTELIGFEDEVLINFIYGLLDGKEINGKEVQISLTGFMERNTGKFMKELWSLLLSAQKNASGVPQQFLDAKEEETKKKKAESDRIANEIQRRKEKESRELEQERNEKMDRGYILKDVDSIVEPSPKHEQRPSVARSVEEKEPKDKNGVRGRSRVSKSPHSANLSSSPRGMRSRSISKSVSNSRSYSSERRRSRSLSASNKRWGRSGSSERIHRHLPQRSLTPRRRGSPRHSYSPSRRSSYSKRRSSSRSRRRSPSPTRYRMHRRSRSPLRRRFRSPIWRRPRSPTRRSPWNRSRSPIRRRSSSVQKRSPSPIQRKSQSPVRYSSPSPVRQKYRGSRSPMWRRSRSPMRRRSRSPMRRRSRSPIRRRSRSPIRRRSRSPIWRRSRSPIRRKSRSPFWHRSPIRPRSSSPIHHKSPSPIRHESVSPSGSSSPGRSSRLVNHKSPSREWSSASPVQRRSPSPVGRGSPKRHRRSPLQSPRGRIRELEKHTPVRDTVARNAVERLTDTRQRSNSLDRQSDSWDRNDSHIKLKRSIPSPRRSPSVSEAERETSLIEKRSVKIHHTHSPSPSRKAREKKLHNGTSETSADDKEKYVGESAEMRYNSSAKISSPDQNKRSHIEDHDDVAPERFDVHHSVQAQSRDRTELNKNNQVLQRGNKSEKLEHQTKPGQQESQKIRDTLPSEKKKESPIKVRDRASEKNQSQLDDTKMKDRHPEDLLKLSGKVMRNDQSPLVSDSEENDKNRAKVKDKRKHKRSGRRELESDEESSYDSYAEERKEAKRRRKEEKKMRKEEKRRRREEKRRRKEGRREGKQKLKSGDRVPTPSDTDGKHDDHFDDDRGVKRREPGESDMDEPLTVQKRLEIELREKAIELYMAKKGVSH